MQKVPRLSWNQFHCANVDIPISLAICWRVPSQEPKTERKFRWERRRLYGERDGERERRGRQASSKVVWEPPQLQHRQLHDTCWAPISMCQGQERVFDVLLEAWKLPILLALPSPSSWFRLPNFMLLSLLLLLLVVHTPHLQQHNPRKTLFLAPNLTTFTQKNRLLSSFLPSSSSNSLQTSPTSNSPLSPSSNSNLEAPNKHAKRSIFFLETLLNPFFFAFVCSQQAPSPPPRRLLLLLLVFLLSFSGSPGLLFPSQSRRRSKSANKQNKCEDLNTERGRGNERSNK